MTNNDQQIKILQAIKKNQCYSLYKVLHKSKESFAKIVKINTAQKYEIIDSVQFTIQILENASQQQIFVDNFVSIQTINNQQSNIAIISEPYSMTLQAYLKSKVIQQAEALQIFENVVKSVYSFYCNGRWHRNLRPQHFVKIGKIWKIQSFVFDSSIKHCQLNQYCSDSSYQPPQAYEKDSFSQIELDQMIVWNMGSILVAILLSNHRLNKIETLNKFKNKEFSFESIGVKYKFSDELCQKLGKMLHYNPQKRTKYLELFNDPFWSKQVSNHYQKVGKQLLNLSLTRKKTFELNKSKVSTFTIKRVQTLRQQKRQSVKSPTVNEDFFAEAELMEESKPSAFMNNISKTPKSIMNPFRQLEQQDKIMEQGHMYQHPQTNKNQSNFWYFFFQNDDDEEQEFNEPAISPVKNFEFPKNYFQNPENQMQKYTNMHK